MSGGSAPEHAVKIVQSGESPRSWKVVCTCGFRRSGFGREAMANDRAERHAFANRGSIERGRTA